jgi:hypothetical protein
MIDHTIQVGTISWRVCTSVLTVGVAAGIGVLQLCKSELESEFCDSACSAMTLRLAEIKSKLDGYILKTITHRRNVVAAKAFLEILDS